MRERCDNCDCIKATQEQFDAVPGGAREDLCWAEWSHCCEPAPWRERALKAEQALLREEQLLAARAMAFVRLHDQLEEARKEVERLSGSNLYLMGLAAGLSQGEEPDDA